MPKIKTSELAGAALDWAVAVAEGERPIYTRHWVIPSHPEEPHRVCVLKFQGYRQPYEPSQNWGLGGPIIEREKISIRQWTNVPVVHAYMPFDGAEWSEDGASPLIAAMRCYCSSKLGDVVDIPEELTP